MVSIIHVDSCGTLSIREYQGLSTDTKPTSGVASGSTFLAIDTGAVYVYDLGNTNPATSDGWWPV